MTTRRHPFYGLAAAVLLAACLLPILPAQQKSAGAGAAPARVFRAGAATSNITPFLGDEIFGNFGPPPPATTVHDELHARCLALDDGATKLVFVVLDLCVMNNGLVEAAKRLVQEETGLAPDNIVISTVHTHSATSALLMPEGWGWSYYYGQPFNGYHRFLIRRIGDVVRIALGNLEPARIGWGAGRVPQHVFNRRWKLKPGTPNPNPFGGQDEVRTNPGNVPSLLEPAGPVDPEVSFISVQSAQGRPITLLANYSMHYAGGVPRGHISADYFAVFADRVQELLKADRLQPRFVGILSNGTSGDLVSTNYAVPAVKYEPYEKMKLIAADLAQEVYRVHRTVRHRDWVSLKAARDLLPLKIRKADAKMLEYATMVLARPAGAKPFHALERQYAEAALKSREWPETIDVEVQAFRIGELGIAALPFEPFGEIGLEIKAKSPFAQSFTIEQANGSYGYLPTPGQHKLGGYETWLGTNAVEVDASTKIVARLLEMFTRMK